MKTDYKSFTITGVININTKHATGLESTKAEPKRLVAVLLSVSARIGNQILGHIERKEIFSLYDYMLHTAIASGTNQYPSTDSMIRIPIDYIIPVGDRFIPSITCGGTASNVFGSFEYEILPSVV